jgi:hypothetical protein
MHLKLTERFSIIQTVNFIFGIISSTNEHHLHQPEALLKQVDISMYLHKVQVARKKLMEIKIILNKG